MELVTSTACRRALLAAALPRLRKWQARLFSNDLDPLPEMTSLDFVEPDFDGYRPMDLKGFTPPILTPQNYALVQASVVIWTVAHAGATEGVFGVWYTDLEGRYMAAVRFDDGEQLVNAPGLTVSVIPQFLTGPLA